MCWSSVPPKATFKVWKIAEDDLGPELVVGDFDVSPDGREIVFDRVQENSDVVLIDLPPR